MSIFKLTNNNSTSEREQKFICKTKQRVEKCMLVMYQITFIFWIGFKVQIMVNTEAIRDDPKGLQKKY